MEEVALRGTMNKVIKIGDTVHRQIKGNPMLHSYLQYLERVGMPGVPRFLGIDEQGREVLSYVSGKTVDDYADYGHPCLHSDQAICDMAKFLRKLHDISVDFLPMAMEGSWSNPHILDGNYETICHGDAAIWNFALVDDQIAGMFDFDQACPGTRIWDLTITLFSAVLPSCYDYEPSVHEDYTRRRMRLFFDAYGIDCPNDIIIQTTNRLQTWCYVGDEKTQNHYRNVVAYLKSHIYDWV